MTQSGLRNLHGVTLSSSVLIQCLGVETISSKIFKAKLSSDVIKELTQLDVSYLNAGDGIEIHMLIGLNHYWDIIQQDFIRLSCGSVAQNSKLGVIILGACFNNYSTSNMSNAPPPCYVASLPFLRRPEMVVRVETLTIAGHYSIGVNTPVSSMTDSGTCSNKQNDSNMSIVTHSVFSMADSGTCSDKQNDLCCISSSLPTAGNGVRPYSHVHHFWPLGSIGIKAPVSSTTDSGTCSNKQNDSNISIVAPSLFSMTDSGTCSKNQNDLCCISFFPQTAGNGVRPYSDIHDFWSLGSKEIRRRGRGKI